jgi:multiple sugar transport system substrate-binding protein
VSALPGYEKFVAAYPGIGAWVNNLNNSKQTRPVTTAYPKISTAIGQAVQGVLLGKYQPKQALDQAAAQVDGLLSAAGVPS